MSLFYIGRGGEGHLISELQGQGMTRYFQIKSYSVLVFYSIGYLNNQKASELSIDQDGWLHTGDIGYYDEDEHFVLVNKLKDLIKFRGHQVISVFFL